MTDGGALPVDPAVGMPSAADAAAAQGMPPAAVAARVPPSLEHRASVALKVGAAWVTVLGTLALWGAAPSSGAAVWWGSAGYVVAIVALSLAEAIGLDRGRPWAIAAARPVMLVNLVAGAIGAIEMIVHGTIPIPLDVIAAAWALNAPSATDPIPRRDGRASAVVVVIGLVALARVALVPVFGANGLLDVPSTALQASVTAECGTGSATPETIDVTYRWSWSRAQPFPSGDDAVVIRWIGSGTSALYTLGETPATPPGIHAGFVSGAATGPAQQASLAGAASWTWGIDLAVQRFTPGEIHVLLRRVMPDAGTGGLLHLEALYVHGTSWTAMPAETGCSW